MESQSEAAFTSFCNSFANSSVRILTLHLSAAGGVYLAAVAERFALGIAESCLEELELESKICLALSRTTPVRNLDFAFSQIKNDDGRYERLQINRKWKPLLSANVPLGLWPEILHKAHTSPETSHGQEGVLFFLLREKADLVPRNLLRKRKRGD